MTTITRPCPHCTRPYDISHRMHGDVVWCMHCDNWSAVVMFPNGRTELMKCDPPQGTAPAGPTTEVAALVAEMAVMRAELEAVKARGQDLTRHLRVLHSCVDNIECDCLDPPFDRREDPNDPGAHSQYCRIYLEAYISAVLDGREPPA